MVMRRRSYDWILWLLWVLVSVLGWGVGLLVQRILSGIEGTGGGILRLAALGAVVGLGQWLILRWRVDQAGWWVLAGAVGPLAGWVISLLVIWLALLAIGLVGATSLTLVLVISMVLAGTVIGFTLGVLQSMVLPWSIRDLGWWVLASTVGGDLSALAAWVVTDGGSATYAFLQPANPFIELAGLAAVSTLLGAPFLTGLALIWLRRNRSSELA